MEKVDRFLLKSFGEWDVYSTEIEMKLRIHLVAKECGCSNEQICNLVIGKENVEAYVKTALEFANY